MRKVIFLDIDGVMNTKYWDNMKVRDQYGRSNNRMGYDESYYDIEHSQNGRLGLFKYHEKNNTIES